MSFPFNKLILLTLISISHITLSQVTLNDIDTTLRSQLQTAFDSSRNRALLAATVRLIFHDCADGRKCDGCIGFSNDKNDGLQSTAVAPLENIYNSGWNTRLTRSDFWAAAGTIAVQYAQQLDNSGDTLPNIPFYIGRQDCATSPNSNLASSPFPNEKGGWTENLNWFQTNFGFDIRKTVAIIGAHTLGRLHPQFSGYGSGNNGSPWVGGDDQLNNAFYRDLIRRQWVQQQNGQGLMEWRQAGNGNRVFLNSDITMFKNLDGRITNTATGAVSCTFNSCPTNVQAASLVQTYASNNGGNQQWLNDFAVAFDQMIKTGYGNSLSVLTNTGGGNVPNPPNPQPPQNAPSPPPVFVPPPTVTATRRPRGGGRGRP